VLIDLEDFKQVNDALGFPVGDQVLLQVAERIRRAGG
jgi:diguanylate cyclase (GGDEF)-like protein